MNIIFHKYFPVNIIAIERENVNDYKQKSQGYSAICQNEKIDLGHTIHITEKGG